jgi:hypothetical protein
VPSNISGGNTQQAVYNPGVPYYAFVNNMVHSTPFQYAPPPHHMYQAPMATATNAGTGAHAATPNHQYQGKYTTTQYTYDASQGGPSSDFGKTSYSSSGSGGVGSNSNTGKTGTGSTPGSVSQSTDLNSSMYSKSHNMGKMNVRPFQLTYINTCESHGFMLTDLAHLLLHAALRETIFIRSWRIQRNWWCSAESWESVEWRRDGGTIQCLRCHRTTTSTDSSYASSLYSLFSIFHSDELVAETKCYS